MARAAARESVTIAECPERVAVARAFAAAALGRQRPAGETAVLLLSELVTNSVRHSASGLPGAAGLYLVDSLAARWGFEQDGDHTTTWSSFSTADH